MPKTESPLRYPGGKAKLYSLIKPIISQNIQGRNRTYIEPFAGGAGLALQLLYNGDVDRLVLNDIDYKVFCFWDICLHDADSLCTLIRNCEVNMETWLEQRDVYANPSKHTSLEIAFATFFLNRCNVSGIICGGPIGGHNQTGKYKLDARFIKGDLIRKIQCIYSERGRISFFNLDAKEFLRQTPQIYGRNETIFNIDPPYVKKGPILYENSFTTEDHTQLAQTIRKLDYKWIVTYDECETVYNLYPNFRKEIITLNYSIGNTRTGRELIIYSDNIDLAIPVAL